MAYGFGPSNKPVMATTARPSLKAVKVPSPQGGVNALVGLSEMAPEDAVFIYNMIPTSRGLQVRKGYITHAENVGDEIRTVLPYTASDGTDDKLFVAANDGIYDISSGGAGPWTASVTFGTDNDVSGFGNWVGFVSDAGSHYMAYCDQENGYYLYDEGGAGWAAVSNTDVTNVDPADFCFVAQFKQRLWFIEKGTASAWYLDAGSIIGAATEFNFGNKFKKGGTLQGLYNWTVDAGEGADDYLVAVSSGGDVVVYKGTDPDSPTDFFLHGVWFVGPPSAGFRSVGQYGGELYMLSTYGITPISRLLSGQPVQGDQIQASRKINPLIKALLADTSGDRGWELRDVPSENLVIVSTPKQTSLPYRQFALCLQTDGWSSFVGLPYLTGDTWRGAFYFGSSTDTTGGTFYRLFGDEDGLSLDNDGASQIEWMALTSFQEYGETAQYHRASLIRPVFISQGVPGFTCEARYDYNIVDAENQSPDGQLSGALWDTAIWDSALWGGLGTVTEGVLGVYGMGRAMAVLLEGRSEAETTLIRMDLLFDSGGFL